MDDDRNPNDANAPRTRAIREHLDPKYFGEHEFLYIRYEYQNAGRQIAEALVAQIASTR